MTIQVLGTGCPTCKKLHEVVDAAVREMGLKTKVDYVTGPEAIRQMLSLGAISSPILMINSQIAMVGFNPDKEAVRKAIKLHLSKV